MSDITAPYNFVPLSETVYFPKWAPIISHDMPFRDGISGQIECSLTATSPILIRDGADPNGGFFKIGDTYAIPGSSLKGMLRSVVEIASFGKIGTRLNNRRFAVRDLRGPSQAYRSLMTETVACGDGNRGFRPLPSAGWLRRDPTTHEWTITPCEYARVEHSDLQGYATAHGQGQRFAPGRLRTSEDKYRDWYRVLGFRALAFTPGEEKCHTHGDGKQLVYRKATNLGQGDTKGTIVFTGQPSPNKHMEFIFYGPSKDELPNGANGALEVSEQVRHDFEFVHSREVGVRAQQDSTPNDEWGYWKPRLEADEAVPVFYLKDQTGGISSLGLALMYRLPYRLTIRQAAKNVSAGHASRRPDLADCIFGYIHEQGADPTSRIHLSLRSRVSLSPAIATGPVTQAAPLQVILSQPKPTYYPNYLRQPVARDGNPNRVQSPDDYVTLQDQGARLRGWKRYPARQPETFHHVAPTPAQQNVATTLTPLSTGAQFTFTIQVHNLRPMEIGALLWAITWGGHPNLRHSLGMGKPIGYGQVAITIEATDLTPLSGGDAPAIEGLVWAFADHMSAQLGGNGAWASSDQLRQLLAMANPRHQPWLSTQQAKLQHMSIGDYAARKRNGVGAVLAPHADPSGRAALPAVAYPSAVTQGAQPAAGSVVPVPGLGERLQKTAPRKEPVLKLLGSLNDGDADELFRCRDGLTRFQDVLNVGEIDEVERITSEPVRAVVSAWIVENTKQKTQMKRPAEIAKLRQWASEWPLPNERTTR